MLIMTPFLSKLVNNMSLTDKKVFFLVLFSIDIFLFMTSIFKLNNSFSQKNFAVMGWCFYYLMGYLIEDIFVTKKNRKYIILLGGIALFIQFILYIGLKLPISYLKNPNPILTLQVFGLYFFLLEYADIFSYKIKQGISFVSKYSFNFYLVHNFVIRYLSRLFDFQISFIRNILYGILLFIIAFGTSLFISVVINYVALKPIQSNLSNLLNIKKINNKS